MLHVGSPKFFPTCSFCILFLSMCVLIIPLSFSLESLTGHKVVPESMGNWESYFMVGSISKMGDFYVFEKKIVGLRTFFLFRKKRMKWADNQPKFHVLIPYTQLTVNTLSNVTGHPSSWAQQAASYATAGAALTASYNSHAYSSANPEFPVAAPGYHQSNQHCAESSAGWSRHHSSATKSPVDVPSPWTSATDNYRWVSNLYLYFCCRPNCSATL